MSKISYYDLVTLRPLHDTDPSGDNDLRIRIVPAHEADAVAGRISADAPVAKAIMHRRQGDTITVHAREQAIPMRILSVVKHQADAMETALLAG